MIHEILKNRNTVRHFLQDDVPVIDLNKILESMLITPSKNCIYPYRVVALTQTDSGKEMKNHLYRYGTTTEWQMKKDNKISNYYINNVETQNIKYVQLLRQVLAPLVLCFIGSFYQDVDHENNSDTIDNHDYFGSRDKLKAGVTGLERLMSENKAEPIIRVTRDISIAASNCLLTAENMGYGTAFVGNATQHNNSLVNRVPHLNLQDHESLILMVCIGKAALIESNRCVEVSRSIIDENTTEIVFWESWRNEHTARWPSGGPFVDDLVEVL
jgi:nitroreductase